MSDNLDITKDIQEQLEDMCRAIGYSMELIMNKLDECALTKEQREELHTYLYMMMTYIGYDDEAMAYFAERLGIQILEDEEDEDEE